MTDSDWFWESIANDWKARAETLEYKYIQAKQTIASERAVNAELVAALKLVMQHGRIDDSEYRMNVVAAALAKAEENGVNNERNI